MTTDRVVIRKIFGKMKKIFLTLVGAVVLMGNAVAQQWDANNFMARVGLNFGNVAMDDFSTDAKVGFHLAGVYERQLFATTPLFLETGLALTQKGYKLEMGGESSKSNMWYLEVPVMVNYKFAVNEEWTLYPSAGIYYALGIGGKTKIKEGGASLKGDTFDGYQRSDLGLRIGFTADWKRYQVSAGYSIGLLDVADDVDLTEVKTRTFFVTVGYRF